MKRLSILAILLICIGCFAAEGTDTITWITRNYPPGWISEGRFAGQGFFQKGLIFLKKELPGYAHLTEDMSNDRMFFLMKTGRKFCRGGLIRTPENEKLMYFTIPNSIYPAVRLYYKKKDAAKFKKYIKDGKISLAALLGDKKLSLGLETIRNYDDVTNALIKKHAKSENIIYRISTDAEALVKMLVSGRFDYLLEYPYTVSYSLKSDNRTQDELIGVRVAEIKTEYLPGCIGAPRNAWGKKVVENINAAMWKIRRLPEYRSMLEEWLPPEDLPAFRLYYDQYFIKAK